jgi:hypothetical protein
MERMRHEGEDILLTFDNATDARALKPYLPLGGADEIHVRPTDVLAPIPDRPRRPRLRARRGRSSV